MNKQFLGEEIDKKQLTYVHKAVNQIQGSSPRHSHRQLHVILNASGPYDTFRRQRVQCHQAEHLQKNIQAAQINAVRND